MPNSIQNKGEGSLAASWGLVYFLKPRITISTLILFTNIQFRCVTKASLVDSTDRFIAQKNLKKSCDETLIILNVSIFFFFSAFWLRQLPEVTRPVFARAARWACPPGLSCPRHLPLPKVEVSRRRVWPIFTCWAPLTRAKFLSRKSNSRSPSNWVAN